MNQKRSLRRQITTVGAMFIVLSCFRMLVIGPLFPLVAVVDIPAIATGIGLMRLRRGWLTTGTVLLVMEVVPRFLMMLSAIRAFFDGEELLPGSGESAAIAWWIIAMIFGPFPFYLWMMAVLSREEVRDFFRDVRVLPG